MSLIRLYVDDALAEGSCLALPKEQTHYLGAVLRKRVGDEVRIFNVQDGEWRAKISSISKKSARLIIKDQLRVPRPCPDITLCFAPVRNCLLYTSPSPRDKRQSRMPSSA